MNNQNDEKLSKPIAFSNERVCLEELSQKEHKHFHPSGNLIPSKADTMMTDRMNTICEMMGMPLVDHVIVGGDNREYFSFKEKGMLKIPTISLAQDYKTFDMSSPLVAEKGKTR